jgi:hypothetical protein
VNYRPLLVRPLILKFDIGKSRRPADFQKGETQKSKIREPRASKTVGWCFVELASFGLTRWVRGSRSSVDARRIPPFPGMYSLLFYSQVDYRSHRILRETIMSETVSVVAPSNMEAGYQFDATVDKRSSKVSEKDERTDEK